MLTENYTYTVSHRDGWIDVVLTQKETGKTKSFTLVGGPVDGIINHMESLTDECCNGFFPAERKKKVKNG